MNNQELATAIRKGLNTPGVVESAWTYLTPQRQRETTNYNGVTGFTWSDEQYGACAWGLAFIGTFNTAKEAFDYKVRIRNHGEYDGKSGWDVIKEHLGVDQERFEKVESLHKQGYSALSLADMIERGEV